GLGLVLRGPASPPAHLGVAGAPRFARDLPAGPFRARIQPWLEIRALLPLVTVTARRTTAVRRDGSGKGRVALDLYDDVWVEGSSGAVAGGWAVEVAELAGYPKDARKARALLASLGLEPAAGLLESAQALTGVDPRGFQGSPTVRLGAGEPALEAFRRVFANLAATMEANRQGTVDDIDPEFLHDLRVAVRRTRSVLAQGRRVLPVAVRDRYREEFGWLGGATGPARDLDVYVIEWEGYVAPLGRDGAAALGPVLDHVVARRRAEHDALNRALDSPRHHTLVASWDAWLRAGEVEGAGPEAGRPIGRVAADRVARAQAQVLARGRSIDAGTPAEVLHELRKDAKKLRYLLECFGGLYDPRPLKAFVQRLKALQDNLGEHQDAEVHAAQLRDMATELHGRAGVGPDTIFAMGRLTEHLEERRQAARDEFAERFSGYDTKPTARALEDLLASDRARS
ncbi:MAG TPA: CHAD domain-containing protein, partial [Acidimicrobiales bacterium]|nr:CHAD domain-containing protein [Acidimicrobiales bacterium]